MTTVQQYLGDDWTHIILPAVVSSWSPSSFSSWCLWNVALMAIWIINNKVIIQEILLIDKSLQVYLLRLRFATPSRSLLKIQPFVTTIKQVLALVIAIFARWLSEANTRSNFVSGSTTQTRMIISDSWPCILSTVIALTSTVSSQAMFSFSESFSISVI